VPIANNNLHLEKDISAGYQKMSCVKELSFASIQVPKYIVPL
jgi:hypothetical protein